MSLAKRIAEEILYIILGLFAVATNSVINVAILTDPCCRQRLILTFGLSFCGLLVGMSTSAAGIDRLYIVLTHPTNYDIKNVTAVDCIKRPYIWGFFIANFTPQLLILPIAVFKLLSVTKPLYYEHLVKGLLVRLSIVLAIYAFSILLFMQEMIRLSSKTKFITYNVCYFYGFETSDMILTRYVLAFAAIMIAIGMQLYTLIRLLRQAPLITPTANYEETAVRMQWWTIVIGSSFLFTGIPVFYLIICEVTKITENNYALYEDGAPFVFPLTSLECGLQPFMFCMAEKPLKRIVCRGLRQMCRCCTSGTIE